MSESFESADFAAGNDSWHVTTDGPVGTASWERQTTATASNGSGYLIAPIPTIPAGYTSTLFSPSIGLASVGGPINVQFDYAYARRTVTATEALALSFSLDCGTSWSFPITLTAQDLNTKGTQLISSFSPSSATDWQTYTIPLPATFTQAGPSLRARFEVLSGGGNAVYLDNFRISSAVATHSVDLARWGISVAPNPVTDETALRFTLPTKTNVQVRVLDMLGRLVSRPVSADYGPGTHALPLRGAGHLPAGVYIVQLQLNDEQHIMRVLVR